jgi:SNF2 family DNA or RNA helicase
MVNFAVPWYLGTLKEFQVNYSDVIATHQRSMSTEGCAAADELKARLSKILIRRTHDDILRFILPPRRELIVSIELSPQQRTEYIIEMQKISDELKCASDIKSVLPTLSKLRQICTKSMNHTGAHAMDEEEFKLSGDSRYQISSKFKFLEDLLLQVKETNPKERVVVTSNYIENLDECKVDNIFLNCIKYFAIKISNNIML